MMNATQKAKLKRQMDILWQDTIKTYLDSNLHLQAYLIDNKYKTDFMVLYTFYAIRERLIIATRRLVEPAEQKNRITIYSIIKLISAPDFEASEEDKAKIQQIVVYFNELFKAEHFKRVKDIRDSFCHNLVRDKRSMCLNTDLMAIIQDCLNVLTDLYAFIGETLPDFTEMKTTARQLAIVYWDNITKSITPHKHGKYVAVFNKWQNRDFK